MGERKARVFKDPMTGGYFWAINMVEEMVLAKKMLLRDFEAAQIRGR